MNINTTEYGSTLGGFDYLLISIHVHIFNHPYDSANSGVFRACIITMEYKQTHALQFNYIVHVGTLYDCYYCYICHTLPCQALQEAGGTPTFVYVTWFAAVEGCSFYWNAKCFGRVGRAGISHS